MRYIEPNSVRAGLADASDYYCWLSYRHHAGEHKFAWLSEQQEYLRMGGIAVELAEAYIAV